MTGARAGAGESALGGRVRSGRLEAAVWGCVPFVAEVASRLAPVEVVGIDGRAGVEVEVGVGGRSSGVVGQVAREVSRLAGDGGGAGAAAELELIQLALVDAMGMTGGEVERVMEGVLNEFGYAALIVGREELEPGRGELAALPVVAMWGGVGAAGVGCAVVVCSMRDERGLAAAAGLMDGSGGGGEAALVSEGGGSAELDRVLDRVAEQAYELAFIKNAVSYRLATKVRRSFAWRAAQKLKRGGSMLRIRPLGRGSAASQGDEVWVRSIKVGSNDLPVPWDFVDRRGPWGEKTDEATPYGKCFVASGGEMSLATSEDPEVEFLAHAWSGMVEIEFGGRREVIDLHAPSGGTVRVFPGRTPMVRAGIGGGVGRAGPVGVVPAGSARPERGSASGFSARQEAWIGVTRAAGAKTAAVHCPRWLGVSSSTRCLFDHCYGVPETAAEEPYSLDDARLAVDARVLLEAGVRHVVFSGGDESHYRLMKLIRKLDGGVRCDMLWHGNIVQWSDDYAWRNLTAWIDAAKAGDVHAIGTVKKGMERVIAAAGLGDRARFVMNYVRGGVSEPPELDESEYQIGLWMSGTLWKTPNVMLAALKLLDGPRRGVTLHTAGVDQRTREIAEYLGLRLDTFHDKTLPQAMLLEQMARTHLTMYVTFNECCPMIPLESLGVGVPCVVGPTSHLFEDDAYLFERLVVPFPDRAEVIAEYSRRAIEERREIVARYRAYEPGYRARAEASVAAFLAE